MNLPDSQKPISSPSSLIQINLVHILLFYFFKVNFNIIFSFYA
jgi:hypothetical protein